MAFLIMECGVMRTYESKSVQTPPYKVESNGWPASVGLAQARSNYMPLGDLELMLDEFKLLAVVSLRTEVLQVYWLCDDIEGCENPLKCHQYTICDVQDIHVAISEFELHDPVSYPRVWAQS